MKSIFSFIKGKAGFTMLELIMVIIIIGILATLAIPQYTNFMEKARASEAINTIGAIKTAQDLFRMESAASTYAAAIGDLDIIITDPSQYWQNYTISAADADGFTVTVSRISDGSTLVMTWDRTDGSADWSASTHTGAPN